MRAFLWCPAASMLTCGSFCAIHTGFDLQVQEELDSVVHAALSGAPDADSSMIAANKPLAARLEAAVTVRLEHAHRVYQEQIDGLEATMQKLVAATRKEAKQEALAEAGGHRDEDKATADAARVFLEDERASIQDEVRAPNLPESCLSQPRLGMRQMC
jgi:hypothetical protein